MNRIQTARVTTHNAVPTQAEVHVHIHLEQPSPTGELRGRLLGPRCPYADTIEIAYPLRPLSTVTVAEDKQVLSARAYIPEASLWDPISPFLYEGIVELWEQGTRVDRVAIRQGLRQIAVRPDGFFLNGRPFSLVGRQLTDPLTETTAHELRQSGVNLLILPVDARAQTSWELAARLGFLLVGQVDCSVSVTQLQELAQLPSALAWVLTDRSASLTVPGRTVRLEVRGIEDSISGEWVLCE